MINVLIDDIPISNTKNVYCTEIYQFLPQENLVFQRIIVVVFKKKNKNVLSLQLLQ